MNDRSSPPALASRGAPARAGERRDAGPAESLPPLASSALLRGHSVVRIEHNGALYQLRSTRLGKLILTK